MRTPSAASACGRCSAWPRARRSAARPSSCCRPPPRSSSCIRSRSSTTTCRRSTTTASAAAPRPCGPGTTRRRRSCRRRPARRGISRLALLRARPAVARELVEATLAMIGGQWLDIRGDGEREELHRLKTGALFSASVGLRARPRSSVPQRRAATVACVRRRSSGCSSRSSTTSSTATVSCSMSASTAPRGLCGRCSASGAQSGAVERGWLPDTSVLRRVSSNLPPCTTLSPPLRVLGPRRAGSLEPRRL